MELKVNGKTITKYNNVAVSLKYDSVGSTFGFNLYFNPASDSDKYIFLPFTYNRVEIRHNGELLITGVLIGQSFSDSAKKEYTQISGYSITGVLEDCTAEYNATLVKQNVSLIDWASYLITPFGLNVTATKNVSAICDEVFPVLEIKPSQTIKDCLSTYALQKNVVLSHTPQGDLLLTQADSSKKPIFAFKTGTWLNMTLVTNGQAMNDQISVTGQYIVGDANGVESAPIKNPYLDSTRGFKGLQSTAGYVPLFRPRVVEQTTGNANTPPLLARRVLGNQIKTAIRLSIQIQGWTLNGVIPRPADIVTVENPELFLYQKSKWFIESVDFQGDEKSETATLNCVLPESFNNDSVFNIFTGTNLVIPYVSDLNAHAVITPFDQP
jgi:prophage tail gpP-like protein